MDAQELRNLQEAYMEVVENQQFYEGWTVPNLARMVSRLGNLEKNIPDNRRDSPEYARYRRVADVVSNTRNKPNKPFSKPAGDDYLNNVWNKFSSRVKPQAAVKNNLSNSKPTSKQSSLPSNNTRFRSTSGSGSNVFKDKMGDYSSALRSRGVRGGSSSAQGLGSSSGSSGYTPGSGRGYGISGIRLADSYEYDVYDIILSHLLDEGYAETPEAAEAIMVNMSEEWRNSIIG
jgi:hypothetical protein